MAASYRRTFCALTHGKTASAYLKLAEMRQSTSTTTVIPKMNLSVMRRVLCGGAITLLLAACAPSSHILTGTARAPISPADVKIYSTPPAHFDEIALLDASSKSVFSPGGQNVVDKVIERLKIQAAQLGANGVILGAISDHQTGSLGTGVGSDSYGRSSSVGVGVGGSLGIYKKTGKGTAIYVPPGIEIPGEKGS